jgi:hypothetical protein
MPKARGVVHPQRFFELGHDLQRSVRSLLLGHLGRLWVFPLRWWLGFAYVAVRKMPARLCQRKEPGLPVCSHDQLRRFPFQLI